MREWLDTGVELSMAEKQVGLDKCLQLRRSRTVSFLLVPFCPPSHTRTFRAGVGGWLGMGAELSWAEKWQGLENQWAFPPRTCVGSMGRWDAVLVSPSSCCYTQSITRSFKADTAGWMVKIWNCCEFKRFYRRKCSQVSFPLALSVSWFLHIILLSILSNDAVLFG